MPPIVLASLKGRDPLPGDLAEVRIVWQAGGAMLLPLTTYERALESANRWALAMHQDGRDGVIMISCL